MKNPADFFSKNISGKRIIVTGGTTGIGFAIADSLVALGASVVILGRDRNDFDKAINKIRKLHPEGRIFGAPADVSDESDIKMIFELADKELGGLDILINNAALPADGVTKGNIPEWKYIIETNVLAYLSFTRHAIERMTASEMGHIVNIGSMSAETREETGTVYVTTKAAIQGFSAALRKEINPLGIKVSLIEPGAVTSDMQPGTKAEHRKKIEKMEMLEAEDIAMSVLFCLAQPQRSDVVTMQIRPFQQLI